MGRFTEMGPHQRLVAHVQELERLEQRKADAAADLKDAFTAARSDGYDVATLKVVLKLRKMTPSQRQERRALEAIYMGSLGMLDGEALSEEARRRLDTPEPPPPDEAPDTTDPETAESPETAEPPPAATPKKKKAALDEQPPAPRPLPPPPLPLKDPAEARQEGAAAAAAGKRIYDNPYPAGDPCRAAWDEGWCAAKQSNGMETPSAYQRRSPKPAEKGDKDEKDGHGGAAGGDLEKGAA